MKPIKIINSLSKKITEKSFLKFVKDKKSETNTEIPIQPIMDIVNFSLAKNDSFTAIHGLQIIQEHFTPIIKNNNIEIQKRQYMFHYILIDLHAFALLAIDRRDEKSADATINSINSIISCVIDELKVIQINESNNVDENPINSEDKKKRRSFEGMIMESIYAIRNIGEIAVEKELRDTSSSATKFINDICMDMISLNSKFNINIAISSLEYLGILFTKNRMDFEIQMVLDDLREIIFFSYKLNLIEVYNKGQCCFDEIQKKIEEYQT